MTPSSVQILNRILRLATAILVSVARVAASEAADTGIELPPPTGRFEVGTVSLSLTDFARRGIYDDGSTTTAREIMVQIWYPAMRRASGPKSEYTDELTLLYALTGDPEPEPDLRLLIQTHAIVGAKMPPGHDRFPVLIFSPGLGLFYAVYQSLFEDLASHGYIVIAVNSPDAAGITVYPDGHAHLFAGPPASTDADLWLESTFHTVKDDLKFVARQLSALDRQRASPLAGRIRMSEIGCFGHSIGGAAAVEACIETPTIAGALNLDGRFHGEGYQQAIVKPMMLILAENHPADETVGIFWQNLKQGGFKLTLGGTGHLSFTDEPFLLDALGDDPSADPDFGTMNPTRCIKYTREAVRGFFDSVLRDQRETYLERLLKRQADVQISRRLPVHDANTDWHRPGESCCDH